MTTLSALPCRMFAQEKTSANSSLTFKVYNGVRNLVVSCVVCLVFTNGHIFSGFESRERVYRNFPEALLHWKVALEVVSMLVYRSMHIVVVGPVEENVRFVSLPKQGQIVVEINSPVVLHDPSDSSLLSPPDTSNNKVFMTIHFSCCMYVCVCVLM